MELWEGGSKPRSEPNEIIILKTINIEKKQNHIDTICISLNYYQDEMNLAVVKFEP